MINIQKYINISGLTVIFYYFVVYTLSQSTLLVKNQNFTTTFILVCSFLILIVYNFKHLNKIFNELFWFSFMFLYMIVYTIFYYFFPSNYITDMLLIFQLKIIIYSILHLMLGIVFYENMNKKYFFILLSISFIILILFVLLNIDYNSFKYKLKYHLIGAILPIIALFIIFLINKKNLRFLVFTTILILLFFINSRAAFYSFFVIYLIYILKEIGYKKSLYLLLSILLLSILLYSFNIVNLDERMFGITTINQDGSFNERLEQFKYGFEAIKNNWFFGQYGGQVIFHDGSIYKNGLGSYMHNIFSFWRQFGVLFFIIFVIFYFSRLLKIYNLWKTNNIKYNFIFYLGLYMSINILFFHSYDYPQIWFVFILMHLYIMDECKNV